MPLASSKRWSRKRALKFSVADVAAALGCSRARVCRDIRRGRLALEDLESVSAYVASGILAHKAVREVPK
jgi:IS30 family transposase